MPLTISLLCSYVPRVSLAANGISQCRTEGPINLIRPREALVSGKSSNPVPERQRYPRERSITRSTVMMPHYWLNCLFITAVWHFGACLKKYNDRNLPYGFEAESKLHAAMFHLSVRKPSPLSSLFNLAPILSHSSPSTFWGDSQVRFGSCDASGIQRSDNSSSIISDSTSIFLLQESVRFRFFSFCLFC